VRAESFLAGLLPTSSLVSVSALRYLPWFDPKGKKGKGSPYSITERWVPELIPVLYSQPAGDVSHKPGCHYFTPGLQLPPQPLRGLLPILLLGEQRHNGCQQFA